MELVRTKYAAGLEGRAESGVAFALLYKNVWECLDLLVLCVASVSAARCGYTLSGCCSWPVLDGLRRNAGSIDRRYREVIGAGR